MLHICNSAGTALFIGNTHGRVEGQGATLLALIRVQSYLTF